MGRAQPEGKRPIASVALKRETLASQAAARIREMILSLRFPPGMRLVETELAAMLGVSRMPVREALQALGHEGLVALTVSKGAIVAERDPQELVDLFDARIPLEVRAVELAVERAAAACVAALDPILAELRRLQVQEKTEDKDTRVDKGTLRGGLDLSQRPTEVITPITENDILKHFDESRSPDGDGPVHENHDMGGADVAPIEPATPLETVACRPTSSRRAETDSLGDVQYPT